MNKYFPKEKNVNVNKLQISEEGKYSITYPKEAELITKLIEEHVKPEKLKDLIIMDATANVGGNTINFSKYFKEVIAIEMNPEHCAMLEHNVKQYKRENVTILCDDMLNHMNKQKEDIIFIDPPWGGKSYKQKNALMLFLSKQPITKIINLLHTKLIVIKVPFNFHFNDFFKYTKVSSYTLYKIRNYYIIFIHKN